MKKLPEETKYFNMYKGRTKVIKNMKSSGSTCPFDQISALALRRCPVLRTTLHRIISHCWSHQKVSKCWKLDFTILIYKKDSPGNPGNFNPIPLEPICAKVFTSLIKNRTYTFITENSYTEANIQKGFWSGVSGKVEHTETLT